MRRLAHTAARGRAIGIANTPGLNYFCVWGALCAVSWSTRGEPGGGDLWQICRADFILDPSR